MHVDSGEEKETQKETRDVRTPITIKGSFARTLISNTHSLSVQETCSNWSEAMNNQNQYSLHSLYMYENDIFGLVKLSSRIN